MVAACATLRTSQVAGLSQKKTFAASRVAPRLRVVAAAQEQKAAAVAALTAAALAVAPAAQAAQEALVLAEGEPLIQSIGWAATCTMFSFSLALVVWGRSGL